MNSDLLAGPAIRISVSSCLQSLNTEGTELRDLCVWFFSSHRDRGVLQAPESCEF